MPITERYIKYLKQKQAIAEANNVNDWQTDFQLGKDIIRPTYPRQRIREIAHRVKEVPIVRMDIRPDWQEMRKK